MVEILAAATIAQMACRQRGGATPAPLGRSDLARLIAGLALIAAAVGALDLISVLPGTGDGT